MASKRMFALQIVDSDAFIEMPLSTQALYFHLGMRADDEGFINNTKTIMRMVGCKEDDLKLLIAKKFIIPFESGIVVIKHWNINNYIQKDRFHETKYIEEKSQLNIDDKGGYTFNEGTPALEYRDKETKKIIKQEKSCIQPVYNMDTQVSLELDKTRDSIVLDKNSKDNKENKINREKDVHTHDYKSLLTNNIKVLEKTSWNDLDCDIKNEIFSLLNKAKDIEEPSTKELFTKLNNLVNKSLFHDDTEEDDNMPF